MIVSIGEILFDIFEDDKVLGGAPFNFAYHIHRMGFPVRFVSRVGNDDDGYAISETLKRFGFNLEYLQVDPTYKTGKVLVRVDELGKPVFTIVKDAAYDFLEFNNAMRALIHNTVDLIYFGTLVQRSLNGFKTIQKTLERKLPQAKSLYDVNLRPECYSKLIVVESLKHADILKLNDDELILLKKMFGYERSDDAFLAFLLDEFSIEMVALTKGEQGSELFTPDSHAIQSAGELKEMVDTVGAGDGFAALLAIGYLKAWEPAKVLSLATFFAGRLCRIQGAIPTESGFYDDIKKVVHNDRPEMTA